jgi:hypothetical protein
VQLPITMGDQNVCGGTRLTLVNKPYPDHVIHGKLHDQIKRGGGPRGKIRPTADVLCGWRCSGAVFFTKAIP